MRNLTNAKKVLVIIMTVMLIGLTGSVFAADGNTGFTFSNTAGGNSSTNTSTGNVSLNSNTSNTGNTQNTSNTANTANTSNTLNTARNTSSYNTTNTTDLPDTGIEDHLPLVALIAVVAISGIYALKKANDYKNL